MFKTGLYINDLSMHDSSRDLVLAGTQQSEELKRALIQVRRALRSCSMFLPVIRSLVPRSSAKRGFAASPPRPAPSVRMSHIAPR